MRLLSYCTRGLAIGCGFYTNACPVDDNVQCLWIMVSLSSLAVRTNLAANAREWESHLKPPGGKFKYSSCSLFQIYLVLTLIGSIQSLRPQQLLTDLIFSLQLLTFYSCLDHGPAFQQGLRGTSLRWILANNGGYVVRAKPAPLGKRHSSSQKTCFTNDSVDSTREQRCVHIVPHYTFNVITFELWDTHLLIRWLLITTTFV